MDSYRLKTKIGPHEFEAEGEPEDVKAQFKAFLEVVAMAGVKTPTDVVISPQTGGLTLQGHGTVASTAVLHPPSILPDLGLSKIMKVEGKVVSLTVRATSIDDAALLLLYGQKVLRESDSVSGYEVMQGLTVSGTRVIRVDRVLDKAGRDGYVIVVGQHRGRRYRLTNTGLTRARELSAALIDTVA